jgi:hypothetical protein
LNPGAGTLLTAWRAAPRLAIEVLETNTLESRRCTSGQAPVQDRRDTGQLGSVTQDFAIFDEGTPQATVIFFDYDDAGLVCGYRVTTDEGTVERCRRQRELAFACSVPLAEFTAAGLDAAR